MIAYTWCCCNNIAFSFSLYLSLIVLEYKTNTIFVIWYLAPEPWIYLGDDSHVNTGRQHFMSFMFSILDAAFTGMYSCWSYSEYCTNTNHAYRLHFGCTGMLFFIVSMGRSYNLYYHYIPSSIHINQSIESTNSGMMQELYYVIDNIDRNVFQLTAFEGYTLHPPISSPLGYLLRFQHCTCHRTTSTPNMESGFWAIFSQAYKTHGSRWHLFHTWQHWRDVLQWSFWLCKSDSLGWLSWQDFSLTGDQVYPGLWPSTLHSSSYLLTTAVHAIRLWKYLLGWLYHVTWSTCSLEMNAANWLYGGC